MFICSFQIKKVLLFVNKCVHASPLHVKSQQFKVLLLCQYTEKYLLLPLIIPLCNSIRTNISYLYILTIWTLNKFRALLYCARAHASVSNNETCCYIFFYKLAKEAYLNFLRFGITFWKFSLKFMWLPMANHTFLYK